ncbi:hypothetical protein [Williamsia sp. 1135]|uniref:hypothetical protein n=1 Tax=Williamsia sp. 1135 TaxID=1889262 RepID=UPI000A1043D8|nr:hypothetical protein [Williamsia sp. 1135]ORM30215.1 hypothetical protein BFL43_19405 [Williamsia sp. 1135]
MESDEARELLRLAERAEAAPYLDYPPTPWWYYPVIGAWAAGMIGDFGWWRESIPLFVGTLVVLIIAEIVFVTWMQRRHGSLPQPGRGSPPAEIGVEWRNYFLALPIVTVVVAVAWWLGGVLTAAVVAFVLITCGLVIYEKRYARAADAVRARLT